MNNKSCLKCNEPINENEKQALILTKANNKILEMENFHFECWKKHFEDAVQEEIRGRRLVVVD